MKLKQKLISLLGMEQKEEEKEVDLESHNSLLGEIRMLRLLLLGEKVDDIPPGLLKRLAEQNQKIYWAVKDEESGLTAIDALKQALGDQPPKQRRKALRSLREKIDVEIASVNEEITAERVLGVLQKHGKLSASDIAIYTSTNKDMVLNVLGELTANGTVQETKEGKQVFFVKS